MELNHSISKINRLKYYAHRDRNREREAMRPGTWRKKQGKRQSSVSPPPSVPFPDLDHQIARTDIDNGTFFFLNFLGFGIKFRFDSFLLWLFGLSIKMFVFSIIDICICFVFLDYRYH